MTEADISLEGLIASPDDGSSKQVRNFCVFPPDNTTQHLSSHFHTAAAVQSLKQVGYGMEFGSLQEHNISLGQNKKVGCWCHPEGTGCSLNWGQSSCSMKLTSHLHPLPMSTINGAVPPRHHTYQCCVV
jgi:hypothetical protein